MSSFSLSILIVSSAAGEATAEIIDERAQYLLILILSANSKLSRVTQLPQMSTRNLGMQPALFLQISNIVEGVVCFLKMLSIADMFAGIK